MSTTHEFQGSALLLTDLLRKAEEVLTKRFPGVEGRVSLLENPTLYLEFCRNKLRLTNGEIGRAALIFPIDKATPPQCIAMAHHLHPLALELEGKGEVVYHEMRRAIEVAKEFNRSHRP